MCHKYFSLFLTMIISGILFSSCGKTDNTELLNEACKNFDHYTNQYFDSQLKSNGLKLHFLIHNDASYKNIPMSLGHYSYETMKKSQAFFIEQINALKKISYEQLTTSRQLSYDALINSFKNELDFADLCLCSEDLSPTVGIQAQLPVLFSEYEFRNQLDVQNYLSLLSSISTYFKEICEFQKTKAAKDCFISQASCDAIIKQCQEFLHSNDIKSNLLYTAFHSRLEQCGFLKEEEKSSYEKQNETILLKNVFPAYQQIIDTLTSLKEQGLCKNENGLCYLKNGKDYYEYLVKNYTGSSLSIPEMKTMIQKQVVSDLKQLYSLISIDPDIESKLSGVQFKMNADQILADLNTRCAKDFTPIEHLKYSLKTVDKNLQNFLSPAFFISPPLDKPDDNVIYVNPRKTTDNLYTVLAHEGIPGHLYQNNYFSSTNPDKIRYLIDCGGYSEGWAVYAEMFSYQYQYDDKNLARAMVCNSSYSLALYCLCDIGVNYEGWKYDDLEKFLENYNIGDPEIYQTIFHTVTEEPGNYLKYYVGYLEIMKTKKYVMKQIGADFNLKKFHNAFLTIGPADFDVVHKWIMHFYNLEQ